MLAETHPTSGSDVSLEDKTESGAWHTHQESSLEYPLCNVCFELVELKCLTFHCFGFIIIQLMFIKHPVCESAHGGAGPSYRSKLNWVTLGHKTGYTCQLPGFCQLLVFGILPPHSWLPSVLWGWTQDHLVKLSSWVSSFLSWAAAHQLLTGCWTLILNPLQSFILMEPEFCIKKQT